MKRNKEYITGEVRKDRKRMKELEEKYDNVRLTRLKVTGDLEKMTAKAEYFQKKIEETNVSSGSSTIASRVSDVQVFAKKEYTPGQRIHLGKYIRNEIFKKWKVTNRKSFDDGVIMSQCHRFLGHDMEKEENSIAYLDCFIKFVNTELGQKRSQVNGSLLRKWRGKNTSVYCVL